MGYTHYWNQSDTITPADWIEFAEGCERLIVLATERGIVLKDWTGDAGVPIVNGAEVSFNGSGDDSHESFRIERRPDPDDFTFCKTARKDYDLVVAAVLTYLDSILPGTVYVTSDGSLENYRDALDLARLAWPSKANILDFPRSLRDEARFASYPDSSERYQVCVGHDGVTYVEDKKTRALRRLPDVMQGADYYVWQRAVPYNMRASGSYQGDYYDVMERRLKKVWTLAKDNPVPTLAYDPMIHGLKNPHITSAQTY